MQRLHINARFAQEGGHQHDGAKGHEDVFAKEQAHVVRRGREGAQLVADALGQLAVARFGGAFGHGGQQRAHHLRVAAQAGQANGGGELARSQVHDEQAACRGRPDGADPVLCVLAQAMALQQANHRQGQQDDERQVARLDKARADGGEDFVDGKPGCHGRAHGRDDHDQHGVKPQDKAHDDDGHPDERPQIDVTKHVDP